MDEFTWLIIIFIVLNVLDGVTTILSLHVLPDNLKAKESNPMFKGIEKSPTKGLVRKFILVVISLFILFYVHNKTNVGGIVVPFRALDIVLLLVVINNFVIFLSRQITKVKRTTPMAFVGRLIQRTGLKEKVADFVAYYLVLGALAVASYFVAGLW